MNKAFDAVGWMRKRRAEIDQETDGLSWQERGRKIQEALQGDALWEALKDEMVVPPVLGSLVPARKGDSDRSEPT